MRAVGTGSTDQGGGRGGGRGFDPARDTVQRRLATSIDLRERRAVRDERLDGARCEGSQRWQRGARARQVQRRATVDLTLRVRARLEQEPKARKACLRVGVDWRGRRARRRQRGLDRR